ncbi:hypothetical protein DYH09_00845 [bacterium CPR1]|nr:hypothetical protein [bacterium CPR1]
MIQRGMDSPFPLKITDGDAVPINLTSCHIWLKVFALIGSTTLLVNTEFTITNALLGEASYLFTGASTSNSTTYPDKCRYEIVLQDSTGKKQKLLFGEIRMVWSAP